ncbi:hypothetical protein ACFLZM_03825 [Thermodesulfobacteriota bacterium]
MSADEQKKNTFDLDEGMIKTIGEEFNVQQIVDAFAEASKGKSGDELDKTASEVFGQYGKQLMKRVMELGEKHTDTTYETLKKAIEKTGSLYFPMVPQRFVEIAYLSTQPIYTLPIVQNNGEKLTYKLAMCDTYKSLKETCGKSAAESLPCKNACLGALETLFKDLNIDVAIGMDATMPEDDFCQFSAAKG